MKILFNTFLSLGDTILSTGVLDYFVRRYPDAKITIITSKVGTQLFAANQSVEQVYVLKQNRLSDMLIYMKLLLAHWDIVIDLKRHAFFYIVFGDKKYRIPNKKQQQGYSRLKRMSTVLGAGEECSPIIHLNEEHHNRAAAILAGHSYIIAICPTASVTDRMWPIEQYISLVNALMSGGVFPKNVSIMVVGASFEKLYLKQLIESIPAKRVIDVSNESILTIAACLKKCAQFVGSDSGFMHLSAAMKVPTIGIFRTVESNGFYAYRPAFKYHEVVTPPSNLPEDTAHPLHYLKVETVIAAMRRLAFTSIPRVLM